MGRGRRVSCWAGWRREISNDRPRAYEPRANRASIGVICLPQPVVGWVEVTRLNIPWRSMASGIYEIAGFRPGSTQPTGRDVHYNYIIFLFDILLENHNFFGSAENWIHTRSAGPSFQASGIKKAPTYWSLVLSGATGGQTRDLVRFRLFRI